MRRFYNQEIYKLCVQAEARLKYEGIIKHLKGGVTQCPTYDPSTTHIIIEKPIRSEKLLCCIASGKWVLHTSYLDSCYESRQFLPVRFSIIFYVLLSNIITYLLLTFNKYITKTIAISIFLSLLFRLFKLSKVYLEKKCDILLLN